MDDPTVEHAAPWGRPAVPDVRQELPDEVDVAVVGGGITGLTAAITAAEQGARVAVLEARYLAAGTTGLTTGKLTSQHGLRYAQLVDTHGIATAQHYARANQQAIDIVDDLVRRYGISCDLEPVAHLVHATTPEGRQAIEQEHEAVSGLDLPTQLQAGIEPPQDATVALRFDDQRHLDPVRYAFGLADALTRQGGQVHTGTRVLGARPRPGGMLVRTEHGEMRARHVVIASLLPPLDRALTFVRQKPVRAYGIALRVVDGLPRSSYLGIDEPTRSVRTARDERGEPRLIVVGESHLVGREPAPEARIQRLRAFTAQLWQVLDLTHQWSAQDYLPLDGLPTVGPLDGGRRCWVASGFGKWGLSQGTYAGWLIARRLAGLPVTHVRHLHRPQRLGRHELADVVGFNLDSGRRLIADRLRASADPETLAPGEGAVVRQGTRWVATHRRDDGSLGRVSACCTHLGCLVAWNRFERSWDCPCHGSRFDADGQVLEGPAIRPLTPLDDDAGQ